MEDYKTKLKTRVLTAFNIFDESFLSEKNEDFEIEISHSASRYLSDMELMAYFFYFGCTETHEEVQTKISKCFNRDIDIDVIKKYAKRATERIINVAIKKDRRFKAWMERQNQKN